MSTCGECGQDFDVRAQIQEQITEASALFLNEALKEAETLFGDLGKTLENLDNREQLKVWSAIFDICYTIAGGANAVDVFRTDFPDLTFYEEKE